MLLLVGTRVVVILVSLLQVRLIIDLVGLDHFGLYNVFLTYISVLLSVKTFGIGFKLHRNLPLTRSRRERARLLIAPLLASVSWFSVIFILGALIYLVSNGGQKLVIIIFASSSYVFCTGLYGFFSDYVKYRELSNLIALNTLQLSIGNFAVLYILKVLEVEVNVHQIFFVLCVAPILLSVRLIVIVSRDVEGVSINLQAVKLRDFVLDAKAGLPVVLVAVFEVIILSTDRWFIIASSQNSQIGSYALSVTLVTVLLVFTRVALVIFEPCSHKLISQSRLDELSLVVTFLIAILLSIFIVICNVTLHYGSVYLPIILGIIPTKSIIEYIILLIPLYFSWSFILIYLAILVSLGKHLFYLKMLISLIFFDFVIASFWTHYEATIFYLIILLSISKAFCAFIFYQKCNLTVDWSILFDSAQNLAKFSFFVALTNWCLELTNVYYFDPFHIFSIFINSCIMIYFFTKFMKRNEKPFNLIREHLKV